MSRSIGVCDRGASRYSQPAHSVPKRIPWTDNTKYYARITSFSSLAYCTHRTPSYHDNREVLVKIFLLAFPLTLREILLEKLKELPYLFLSWLRDLSHTETTFPLGNFSQNTNKLNRIINLNQKYFVFAHHHLIMSFC